MKGSKAKSAEADSNTLNEDIESRVRNTCQPDKIPYVRPADVKNIKHNHFERGNPVFKSDTEDKEELEGSVGGVPPPVQPSPYSEKLN